MQQVHNSHIQNFSNLILHTLRCNPRGSYFEALVQLLHHINQIVFNIKNKHHVYKLQTNYSVAIHTK
jgi:hypothetical protein